MVVLVVAVKVVFAVSIVVVVIVIIAVIEVAGISSNSSSSLGGQLSGFCRMYAEIRVIHLACELLHFCTFSAVFSASSITYSTVEHR